MNLDIFEKALSFALRAHHGQIRKKESVPFILHPCEAATIAATLTQDSEVLAAVLLHDTVEDTDTTIEDIRREFGERVAELVQGETENAYLELPRAESWRRRKEESLRHLKETSDKGVRIMWMADKLSNMRSLHRLFKAYGDDMWDGFNQKDTNEQEWYYRTIAEILSGFADTEAYREYCFLTNQVFGGSHENTI